jgi:mono/diheme cytochrome c family protein
MRSAAILSAMALAALLAGPARAAPWTLFGEPQPKSATAVERGRAVFDARCEICHGQGNDRAGTISLQFKYKGSKPALLEERADLTPQLVRYYVRHGVAMMPFFRKTELSDQELDDLAAYLGRQR